MYIGVYVCVGGLVLLKAANGRCRTAGYLEIGSGRAWLDVWQGVGRVLLLLPPTPAPCTWITAGSNNVLDISLFMYSQIDLIFKLTL